jgi:colanic acid biosynthesis glycosyl transferase WcaI
MHILLFNEYFLPDTSATAKIGAEVVDALARRHNVTVLAGRPSYDPTTYYPWRPISRRRLSPSLTVENVGSTAFHRRQMPKRIANYLTYVALASIRVLRIRPDLLLCMTDPPFAALPASQLARLLRCPFVYNIRDLYPDMALGGNIVSPAAWVRWWESAHRRALAQAERIIVLGDDMRDRILSKGISPDRVSVVRDGAVIPSTVATPDDPVVREIRSGFSFVAIHAGNLGFYGAWDTLLAAARLLDDDSALFFIGDGANRARLETAASDCPRIRFLPFRPASEIPFVMAAGDIHIVTIRRGLEGVVVPSKFFSVLAAGRPVLVVAPESSDAARIVLRYRCGLTADPDDPAAVAAAIRRLRSDPEELLAMGRRAREASLSFLREAELVRFVELIEEAQRSWTSSAGASASDSRTSAR